MSLESTPTTVEELQTALGLVADAQQPAPWDQNCFYPRQVGGSPLCVMAVESGGDTITLYFDDDLDEAAVAPESFSVGLNSDPGHYTPPIGLSADNAIANTIELHWEDTDDPVSGRPFVSYDGSNNPPILDTNGLGVQAFTIALTLAD